MNKKVSSKYNYAVVLGLGTFLGLLIVSFLIIKPLYTNAATKTDEKKDKQEKLTLLKDKKAKLEILKEREEELKANAKTVEGALPKTEDVGRLFIQMDEIARTSGSSLKSVTRGSKEGEQIGSSNIMRMSFTSAGDFPTYENYKNFIKKNEKALRIINITGQNISATDTGALSVVLIANTYARNSEVNVGATNE